MALIAVEADVKRVLSLSLGCVEKGDIMFVG
jgi:hypothetical protein